MPLFGSEVRSDSRRRKRSCIKLYSSEQRNVENPHPEQPLGLKMQVELRCQSPCLNSGIACIVTCIQTHVSE